jgi:hypothetical protein
LEDDERDRVDIEVRDLTAARMVAARVALMSRFMADATDPHKKRIGIEAGTSVTTLHSECRNHLCGPLPKCLSLRTVHRGTNSLERRRGLEFTPRQLSSFS